MPTLNPIQHKRIFICRCHKLCIYPSYFTWTYIRRVVRHNAKSSTKLRKLRLVDCAQGSRVLSIVILFDLLNGTSPKWIVFVHEELCPITLYKGYSSFFLYATEKIFAVREFVQFTTFHPRKVYSGKETHQVNLSSYCD